MKEMIETAHVAKVAEIDNVVSNEAKLKHTVDRWLNQMSTVAYVDATICNLRAMSEFDIALIENCVSFQFHSIAQTILSKEKNIKSEQINDIIAIIISHNWDIIPKNEFGKLKITFKCVG